MKAFKFKKAKYEIDKGILEEFNRMFKTIDGDEFLTNTNYGIKVKTISLDGYPEYDKDDFRWGSADEYESSMDKFMGEEYGSKMGLYDKFIKWVALNHKNQTVLGRVRCPYTNEVIKEEYFPSVYTMAKSSYSLGNFIGSNYSYKVKVKVLFKINLKNDPSNHMSKKALDLFFNYWSYDVLGNVTLKDAKDGNLLAVSSDYGTLYYGYGDETWTNQMYYANKGFFVKMKKERVYVPCPAYEGLTQDLDVLSRGGVPELNPDKLPTEDERVKNAVEFGVLDESLMPKKESSKAEVVNQIKKLVSTLETEESKVNVYDRIKDLILGNS